jgi:predicted porin
MNKKLMAVAVAGALAAPAVAFAQASSVQLYGRANLGVDRYEAKGATAGTASDWKGRTRVYDNGSRFGLRGEENLGGGLKALFLMESGAPWTAATATAKVARLTRPSACARVAYVGPASNWGQLTLGRQNVCGPTAGMNRQANYGSVANQTSPAAGRGMGPGVARQSNTVQYASP